MRSAQAAYLIQSRVGAADQLVQPNVARHGEDPPRGVLAGGRAGRRGIRHGDGGGSEGQAGGHRPIDSFACRTGRGDLDASAHTGDSPVRPAPSPLEAKTADSPTTDPRTISG
jgi:hypothetical protein